MNNCHWCCLDFIRYLIDCINCDCIYERNDDEPDYQYFVNENRNTSQEILYEAIE
jgi:hypothetical protein